jgi:hypothetical protein
MAHEFGKVSEIFLLAQYLQQLPDSRVAIANSYPSGTMTINSLFIAKPIDVSPDLIGTCAYLSSARNSILATAFFIVINVGHYRRSL